MSRAEIASCLLMAISAGQPPGSISPSPSIAAGIVSQPLGSKVPVQSNSRRNLVRSTRVSLAPLDMDSGLMRACLSRRTYRKALPFGAQIHLWAVPA
jgi:hypothetical protein